MRRKAEKSLAGSRSSQAGNLKMSLSQNGQGLSKKACPFSAITSIVCLDLEAVYDIQVYFCDASHYIPVSLVTYRLRCPVLELREPGPLTPLVRPTKPIQCQSYKGASFGPY
jgi:hypothetical protein